MVQILQLPSQPEVQKQTVFLSSTCSAVKVFQTPAGLPHSILIQKSYRRALAKRRRYQFTETALPSWHLRQENVKGQRFHRHSKKNPKQTETQKTHPNPKPNSTVTGLCSRLTPELYRTLTGHPHVLPKPSSTPVLLVKDPWHPFQAFRIKTTLISPDL